MEWLIIILGIVVLGVIGAKTHPLAPVPKGLKFKRIGLFNGKAYSRGKCKAALKRSVGIYK